jgi:hypothetical protein
MDTLLRLDQTLPLQSWLLAPVLLPVATGSEIVLPTHIVKAPIAVLPGKFSCDICCLPVLEVGINPVETGQLPICLRFSITQAVEKMERQNFNPSQSRD